MAYSIQQIQHILKGKFLNSLPFEQKIEQLLFDSRHLIFANRTLFFAFAGVRQDGHDFIDELYAQGVRNFVVTKKIVPANYPEANLVYVKNSIKAIQRLAIAHRQQFDLPVIGITGSNGKTIVKEWLFQLLHQEYRIIKNPGSYNSQIGVPLSIWLIQQQHDLGIFEAGISEPKEMHKLAPIIDASIGIFTNIGAAHSEGFKNQEQKIEEKLKLFKNTKTLIYCRDHKAIDQAIKKMSKKKRFTWSYNKKADIQIKSLFAENKNTIIEANYQEQKHRFTIPFTDDASIENALHCYATLCYLGFPIAAIQKKINTLESVSMRLEVKKGINGSILINDSYNSDLTSIEYALNFATKRGASKRLILVLSDILQSGQPSEELYHHVVKLIQAKKVAQLIAIGKEIKIIQRLLPPSFPVVYYESTQAFLQALDIKDFYDAKVLLKGARVFEFERILRKFEEKAHKTVLEVNLSAIAHNLKVFGQFLKAHTKLCAMVKASAYGSGSIEVAKILAFYRVDYLAVAYADEGVELRRAGIQLSILVLNPEEASFDAFLQYELEPEIYSVDLLQQFLQFVAQEKNIPIHLKLDTGMHRLGFEAKDIPALISLLEKNKQVVVKSIFSHLAGSDAAEHDDFTTQQVNTYLQLSQQIITALGYQPLRHILNSSGIVRFPQYQLDMVRLGIGLYGIDSSGLMQSQLKVVNTLKASISQIKEVDEQDTVGYNRSGKINQFKRIATINIGYADGLPRKAGNGRYEVSVKGKKAPIVGNVCMDMCMIDVTHIPQVSVGEEVIIFGEFPTVEDLANCLETIPYEIFTSVSNRVKRIYYRE